VIHIHSNREQHKYSDGVAKSGSDEMYSRNLFPMQTRTRVEALARSNSAYFISIIVVQWADLMICKTRIRSLFEQGMTNTFMNYSLFFETILGAFLVYVPVSNTVTGTRPLRFTWWTAGVPFSLAIYIYDEFRKGWIRKNKRGWIHRNTYW
jgi:sodium/potassium-transporting ATPase subunit alpha